MHHNYPSPDRLSDTYIRSRIKINNRITGEAWPLNQANCQDIVLIGVGAKSAAGTRIVWLLVPIRLVFKANRVFVQKA